MTLGNMAAGHRSDGSLAPEMDHLIPEALALMGRLGGRATTQQVRAALRLPHASGEADVATRLMTEMRARRLVKFEVVDGVNVWRRSSKGDALARRLLDPASAAERATRPKRCAPCFAWEIATGKVRECRDCEDGLRELARNEKWRLHRHAR